MKIKRLLILIVFQILFIACFSQQKAHKITYRYTLDFAKSADLSLIFFSPFFKNKYQYKTFLCYKNISISYNDEKSEKESIKNISELDEFVLCDRGQMLSYELTENDIYKVTTQSNDDYFKIITETAPVRYKTFFCTKIKYGTNNKNIALSSSLYPKEWGCVMLPNYKGCVLQTSNDFSSIELSEDVEIDSMQVIKLINQIHNVKTKKVIEENVLLKAESGEVVVGKPFPAYTLKDNLGNIVDSKKKFVGFKVLFFWSDFAKYMPPNKSYNLISYNKLLKQLNEIASKDVQILSFFWGNEEDLIEFTPEYKTNKSIMFFTSTQNWSMKYLNIKSLITVVITDGNNKVLYKDHLDCLKGQVDALKMKIQSFRK
jgi:hypothetical protein